MTTKAERLEMRLTPELKKLLERAAAISGQAVASFIRAVLSERAQEIVDRQTTTVLSQRDFKRFLSILDKDQEPAPALRAAVRWAEGRRG
ncbi:MAG TPA: DUF1778 domain-containing protein [Planctomycetota bacterium]|nr:DUF1778 domain-containing protein [Planctomycetota bacterium]